MWVQISEFASPGRRNFSRTENVQQPAQTLVKRRGGLNALASAERMGAILHVLARLHAVDRYGHFSIARGGEIFIEH
jgi:hypothetical protein